MENRMAKYSTGKLRDGRRICIREADGRAGYIIEPIDAHGRRGLDTAFNEEFRLAKEAEDRQWINSRGAGWNGVVDGIEVYTFDDCEMAKRHPEAIAERQREIEEAVRRRPEIDKMWRKHLAMTGQPA